MNNQAVSVTHIEKADGSYDGEFIFALTLSNGVELEVWRWQDKVSFDLYECPEPLKTTAEEVAKNLENMGYQWTWKYLTSKFKELSS